jgi:hypothetical protein
MADELEPIAVDPSWTDYKIRRLLTDEPGKGTGGMFGDADADWFLRVVGRATPAIAVTSLTPAEVERLQRMWQWMKEMDGPAPQAVAEAPPPMLAVPPELAPAMPAREPRAPLAAYIPFIAAVLELPWIGIIIFTMIVRGNTSPSAVTARYDLIAMIPAAFGLLFGIVALVRGKVKTKVPIAFLLIGCLACGLFVFVFGWEFFH